MLEHYYSRYSRISYFSGFTITCPTARGTPCKDVAARTAAAASPDIPQRCEYCQEYEACLGRDDVGVLHTSGMTVRWAPGLYPQSPGWRSSALSSHPKSSSDCQRVSSSLPKCRLSVPFCLCAVTAFAVSVTACARQMFTICLINAAHREDLRASQPQT